jgi:tight adherence protein B
LTLTLLTVLTVIMALLAGYGVLTDLVLRDRSLLNRRVDEEFRKQQRDRLREALLIKKQMASEAAERPLRKAWNWFENLLAQTGLPVRAGQLLAIMGGVGILVGGLAIVVRPSVVLGMFAGAVGAAAPLVYVFWQRRNRLDQLLGQLPDALDLMARILRAGRSMAQAIQAVAEEFDLPIAAEFSHCHEQQNLGMAPVAALRELAQRSGVVEMKILVLTLLVQQETGGNIAELLEGLAAVVRDRLRLRQKVRALTGEGRMQANILLAMPILLFGFMLFFHPEYVQELLDRPKHLIGTVSSMGIGALIIRKIVNFEP